jgi:hypothetical protein
MQQVIRLALDRTIIYKKGMRDYNLLQQHRLVVLCKAIGRWRTGKRIVLRYDFFVAHV